MTDKILETKKAMRCAIRAKGLSRLDKYNLVKDKISSLTECERKILLKECRRDYESYDRSQDVKELITISIAGIGLLITLLGIIVKDLEIIAEQNNTLILNIGVFVLLYIFILAFSQIWRNKNMYITKYMIDILEDNE